MPGDYRNIYKNARSAAGYTQERAAEMLGISVESLRAYETGGRVPGNNTVERMIEIYSTPYLAYQHLKESNALMSHIIPALEERTMLETCVRIFTRLHRFSEQHSVERLLEIAEDNVIGNDERPEFYAIMADLREIVKSGLELEVYLPRWARDVV